MSSRWRLLSALILLAVAASGVGSYLTFYRQPGSHTMTITPVVTTASSTGATMGALSPTEWIKVGEVKPINHYLSLLDTNGTQPYSQLARELRKLLDLTNATAVAKITILALNATNPEVKEAFELMMKGGTPDPRDFGYSVPNYNTELQVLYWLASQSEFKKDDTLALAIAMINGLWVTMGDQQVRETVKDDVRELLNLFRETNELQRQGGRFPLEGYPLEAKIALAWTGNDVSTHGWHALASRYREVRLPLKGYGWNTVSVKTLRDMRQLIGDRGWEDKDPDVTAKRIGDIFWNNLWYGGPTAWEMQGSFEVKVLVDGEEWPARNMNNADFEFEYFLVNGKGIGVCEDNMVLRDALMKSCGIATLPFSVYFPGSGDTQPMHYNPQVNAWKVYDRRLMDRLPSYDLVRFNRYDVYVFRPPVIQRGYFKRIDSHQAAEADPINRDEVNNSFYPFFNISPEGVYEILIEGIPTSQMKQWLLYS